jgi:hypothetical protein
MESVVGHRWAKEGGDWLFIFLSGMLLKTEYLVTVTVTVTVTVFILATSMRSMRSIRSMRGGFIFRNQGPLQEK